MDERVLLVEDDPSIREMVGNRDGGGVLLFHEAVSMDGNPDKRSKP